MGGKREKNVDSRRTSRWAQDGELAQSREAELDSADEEMFSPSCSSRGSSELTGQGLSTCHIAV